MCQKKTDRLKDSEAKRQTKTEREKIERDHGGMDYLCLLIDNHKKRKWVISFYQGKFKAIAPE